MADLGRGVDVGGPTAPFLAAVVFVDFDLSAAAMLSDVKGKNHGRGRPCY